MNVTTPAKTGMSRGAKIGAAIALIVLVAAAAALAWFYLRGDATVTTPSGLRYQVLEEGTGEPATRADLVAMRYVLSKEDGTVIQNSNEMGQPFVVSAEMVFPGFAEGLQLMREGGRYKLWVPPRLHYGDQVPPGAPFTSRDTLVFEIQVFQIGRGFAAMARQAMGQQARQPQPESTEGRNPAQDAATPPPAGGGGNSQR